LFIRKFEDTKGIRRSDCHLENEYEDSIDEEQDKEDEAILGLNELDELLDSIDSENDVSSIGKYMYAIKIIWWST
jgi:hypothetical protein